MEKRLTMGSLFDGSGAFPLASMMSGISPIWASEICPYPIRVTTKRLPFMKHYGDVCNMDGGKVEPVDIITFGSPCQDMSIAGKREGLNGARSGLFHQAVRIMKEMKEVTNGEYPKYAVWENVCGALSSNDGEDFRCVLESLLSVTEQEVSIPRPKKGKWRNAGEIMGGDFSIAWRVLSAEYFGVPQKRKRIYLVADFGGGRAGKILFEREGMPWHTPEGFQKGEGVAEDLRGSLEDAGRYCLNDQGGDSMNVLDGVAPTLRAQSHQHEPLVLVANVKVEGTMNRYIVRRITPTECARLQGMPDWWCDGLEIDPSTEEMEFWRDVFETWRMATSPNSKPKTDRQIRKWLAGPFSDSEQYKMWGNGIALPCGYFVLSGIACELKS